MMEATQFKDSKGNIWTLAINIGHYLAMKSKLGIDITESFNSDDNWMTKLASHDNIEILLSMIDIILDSERESRGMTLDQMYEGFDGEVVAEATSALIEGIVLFLPAHKRKALRLIVDSVNVGMERAILLIEKEEMELRENMVPRIDEELLKLSKKQ
ncbi:MAG: hypothetical protein CMI26_13125 [Opitutae bacterium]|nr:hypothetical protein [Opitutae bacterium]